MKSKKLLNVVMFGSLFFVALTSESALNASERGFFRTGRDVSKKMVFEHPYLTTIGSSFIGLDILTKAMRGGPLLWHVATLGTINHYDKNGVLNIRPIEWNVRSRSYGGMILGLAFYCAYQDYKNSQP